MRADGTPYADADEVALTNNAITHLFSRIEYHLSNQMIESINYPGQATTMLGLLKYPDDFSKAQVILEEEQLVLEKSVLIKFHGSCLTLLLEMLKSFSFTSY